MCRQTHLREEIRLKILRGSWKSKQRQLPSSCWTEAETQSAARPRFRDRGEISPGLPAPRLWEHKRHSGAKERGWCISVQGLSSGCQRTMTYALTARPSTNKLPFHRVKDLTVPQRLGKHQKDRSHSAKPRMNPPRSTGAGCQTFGRCLQTRVFIIKLVYHIQTLYT